MGDATIAERSGSGTAMSHASDRRARPSLAWTLLLRAVCVLQGLCALQVLCVLQALYAPSLQAQERPDAIARLAGLVSEGADLSALAAIGRLSPARREQADLCYLRGRLLERQGRLEEALAAYSEPSIASLSTQLREDIRTRRGILLSRTGHCAEARALWTEEGRASRGAMVQARMAECALAAGDLPRAVTELRAVLERRARPVDSGAVRLSLGEALFRSGDLDGAVSTLRSLWVERPDHPQAEAIPALLEQITGSAPSLSLGERLDRAERLMRVRRHTDALTEIDRAAEIHRAAELANSGRTGRRTSLAIRRRLLHLHGMALYRARRRYDEAAPVLAASAALGGPEAAEDEFHAARALSRSDQDRAAVIAYRRFARRNRRHARAPEALYLAAWLEIRLQVRGARRRMAAFSRSAAARRAPRFARQALWQLALTSFEQGQYGEAASLFSRYAETGPGAMVRGRGLYWLGRARQEQGRDRAAARAYRQALYVEPLHWYALLARQRLQAMGQDPGAPFPEPPEAGLSLEDRISAPALPEIVRFYARLGLIGDATSALRSREAELRRNAPRRLGLAALMLAYRQLGVANRPMRLVASSGVSRRRQTPGPADRWLWQAAYPRPYREQAMAAAAPHGLSASHLYAVMRQESGFNPDVVSYADAIGLMQLLPSTAARVAERVGVPTADGQALRRMLFNPQLNMHLGAAYVGDLRRRLGLPLCFAGFNGGGHNVQRWLRASGEIDLDLFVERIPFLQTRNYVRRVTSHLAHYLYLEDPSAGWPLTLPERVSPE